MSTSSTSSTRHTRPRPRVVGIPKRCWCGAGINVYTSKTPENPYRRFYRCAYAWSSQFNGSDNHAFKWIDEAFAEEIARVDGEIARVDSEIGRVAGEIGRVEGVIGRAEGEIQVISRYMEDQEIRARERVEDELYARVEQAVNDAKSKMQLTCIGAVVVCLLAVGFMKWM